MDTIFALATAQGRAGVSIIRVSGPDAFVVAKRLAGDLPNERVATLRSLKDLNGELIDDAVVLVFEDGRSFTGEKTVEFQTHGSPAIVSKLFRLLSSFSGVRLAEPGEFTRRALENGRLDVQQVEGLADLLEAETELQRKQALRIFSGEFGNAIECWRRELVRAIALLDATIDFSDEELPDGILLEVKILIDGVSKSLGTQLSGFETAERVRNGFEVAIVGEPNVGKSTLLNYLAGREAAITSEFAGTTRDVIEIKMDLSGIPVTFLDTAGIRDTEDFVEGLGIKKTRERARTADLRVFLVSSEDLSLFEVEQGDIVVRSKVDTLSSEVSGVSGLTGQGVDALILEITKYLSEKSSGAGLATRERHRVSLFDAGQHLLNAMALLESETEFVDIVAEEVRSAIFDLEVLIGRVDIESVLGEIFSSFCLGK